MVNISFDTHNNILHLLETCDKVDNIHVFLNLAEETQCKLTHSQLEAVTPCCPAESSQFHKANYHTELKVYFRVTSDFICDCDQYLCDTVQRIRPHASPE